jgi:TRAP-type mannitol/chloroaromatic compound transport system substrate-binding protein
MREKQGVRFFKTPDDVLRAQMGAWSTVVNEKRKENPFFAKVLDSQMAWARRTVTWSMDTMVDPRIAYNHWFGQKAAGPAKS